MDEISYDAIEIGEEYGPYEYPLGDRIARHLEATENKHSWHHERSPWGPPVAPPSILGIAGMRFLDQVAPVPPGTVHAKQVIEIGTALRLDRRLIGYAKFTDKREKNGRKRFTFEAAFRDETGLQIGKSRVTMALPAEAPSEASASKEPKKPDHKADLPAITRKITQEQMTAYSEDSANAQRGKSIHVQPEVAKAAGFKATVAQGVMCADYISELMTETLGQEWYEYGGLSLAFLHPIFGGDTVTTTGRLSTATEEGAVVRKTFDIWSENKDGILVAAGNTQALVRRPL